MSPLLQQTVVHPPLFLLCKSLPTKGRSWPPLLSCAQGRAGASLQEAIDCSSFQNGYRSLGLIHGMIAKHVRQHLGIEHAARRCTPDIELATEIEALKTQLAAVVGAPRPPSPI